MLFRGIGMDPGHFGIASRCEARAWHSGGAARARGARAHEAEARAGDGGVGWVCIAGPAVPTRVLNTQHINTTRHEDHRPRFQAA